MVSVDVKHHVYLLTTPAVVSIFLTPLHGSLSFYAPPGHYNYTYIYIYIYSSLAFAPFSPLFRPKTGYCGGHGFGVFNFNCRSKDGKDCDSEFLLLSQLIYVMQSIGLPEKVLIEVNRLFYKFIWQKGFSNRKAFEKVKRVIVEGNLEDWGLKMVCGTESLLPSMGWKTSKI